MDKKKVIELIKKGISYWNRSKFHSLYPRPLYQRLRRRQAESREGNRVD